MKEPSRAGGSWLKPWTRLNYVQSNLRSSLHALGALGWLDRQLLTPDEQHLVSLLREATDTLERIIDET